MVRGHLLLFRPFPLFAVVFAAAREFFSTDEPFRRSCNFFHYFFVGTRRPPFLFFLVLATRALAAMWPSGHCRISCGLVGKPREENPSPSPFFPFCGHNGSDSPPPIRLFFTGSLLWSANWSFDPFFIATAESWALTYAFPLFSPPPDCEPFSPLFSAFFLPSFRREANPPLSGHGRVGCVIGPSPYFPPFDLTLRLINLSQVPTLPAINVDCPPGR